MFVLPGVLSGLSIEVLRPKLYSGALSIWNFSGQYVPGAEKYMIQNKNLSILLN